MSEYLNGIMGKAGHHAQAVEHIALTLAGAVIWKKHGPLLTFERLGDVKNMIWFEVNGQTYSLKYNHELVIIEFRKDNHRGQLIYEFDNCYSAMEIINVFNGH